MAKGEHPDKAIREAVKFAIERGWELKRTGGHAHAWGILYCPHKERNGCHFGVQCTPRNREQHAKKIRKIVLSCPHREG